MRHLTTTDRHTLRQQLNQLNRQVLEELCASAYLVPAEGEHEVKSYADEAEAERAADVHLAEIEIDHTRLEEIERALARLADGRYGICENCGREIPRTRLFAQPTAIRCTACQTAAEARRRH
jgi:DnaK suppressor protein